MRKSTLKSAAKRLQAMKQRMLDEARTGMKKGRAVSQDAGMDTYDLASEERDREISLILSGRDREKLQAIESALDQIEDGTYGICEECEAEIAPARVEALPFTRLCIGCQSERERQEKISRHSLGDRIYRRLGSIADADGDNV